MTAKGIMNDFYNQFEELNKKLDQANETIRHMALDISMLRKDLKDSNELNQKYIKENETLKLEIERLKNNQKKDSSNSGKSSSTNGFKKVITNNREKSNKKCGGQKGHVGKTLTNETIEKLIRDGEIDEVITIEENKTEKTKKNKPIIKYVYDVKIKRIVTKYIIYPDKETNITRYPVIYGNNLKIIECLLSQKYMSFDGIQSFIYDTTNNALLTSKGSYYTWESEISNKLLNTEYQHIKEELMNSLVVNVDEFGFLKSYKGIIVHDHYKMYYNYGVDNAECNVHVLRYLNAVTLFTNHNWAKELKELLLDMKETKEALIRKKQNKISNEEYNSFKSKYLSVLEKGKKERLKDLSTNAYKGDELCLLNRLIKYSDNHLLFLKKFFVPFSNNRAEADLRGIKIKQKTGKFRSVNGATNYAIIKSCLSTYKKNDINLFKALSSLFSDNPILI